MEFLLRVYESRSVDGQYINGHVLHKCSAESLLDMIPSLKAIQELSINILVLVGVVVVSPSASVDVDLDNPTSQREGNDLRRGNRVYCQGLVYDVEAYIPVAPTKLLERIQNAIHIAGTLQDDVVQVYESPKKRSTLYEFVYAATKQATMLTLDSDPNDHDVITYMKHERYCGGSL